MGFWEPLEFGALALSLRSMASKHSDEIKGIQCERLENLVRYARHNSSLYSEKFASIDDKSFQLEDLPTTTKAEIMQSFDESLTVDDIRRDEVESFFEDESNVGKYFRDKYVLSHTSGSQGQPLYIVQSKDNVELQFALHVSRGNHQSLNFWEAAKHLIFPARLAVVILKPGFYPSASAFAYMPEGARQYIDLLQLSLMNDDLLERLADFRPTHLTAYGSVLHELARQLEKKQGRLTLQPELQQVVNISERLLPQMREHYAEAFGTPVLDSYAMGECLFLSSGCVVDGGMHVNADWAILEVIDEQNQPVPNGEKGAKVLITNLANYVQPIIRYEIGDIITMSTDRCQCGSALPLIENIEGRDSEVLWVEWETGRRSISPAVFEVALSHIADVREYQIVQEDPGRILIRLELLNGVDIDEHHVRKEMEAQFKDYECANRLRVDVEIVEKLLPENGDKFKRVLSHLNESGEKTSVDKSRKLGSRGDKVRVG